MHRFGNSLNSCTGKLYMLKGLYLPNKVNCRFRLQVGRLKQKQPASITCQGCRNWVGGPGCLPAPAPRILRPCDGPTCHRQFLTFLYKVQLF